MQIKEYYFFDHTLDIENKTLKIKIWKKMLKMHLDIHLKNTLSKFQYPTPNRLGPSRDTYTHTHIHNHSIKKGESIFLQKVK